jgi:hypothetical protein
MIAAKRKGSICAVKSVPKGWQAKSGRRADLRGREESRALLRTRQVGQVCP